MANRLPSTAALLLLAILISFSNAYAQPAAYAEGDYDIVLDSLDASRISTDRHKTAARSQTGLTRLDSRKINNGFALFNSPDVIKTIQRLPGVASGTELLSGLYVHGGTGSDNLYLLDGMPLYSASHLIGLFSTFNPDVIENVDFYKSGFPARYGGRLSSVVDVSTREGDMYGWHGTLSVGLIDGRFQIEGPIVKGRTSVNFGMRKAWQNLLTTPVLALLNKKTFSKSGESVRAHYGFWDMNFSLTHRISENDKLKLSAFSGMDKMDGGFEFLYSEYDKETRKTTYYEDRMRQKLGLDLGWGSTTAGLTWDHVISDRASVRTHTFYARSDNKIGLEIGKWSWKKKAEDPDDLSWASVFQTEDNGSLVQDYCMRTDFDWALSLSHHLRFGASVQHHIYTPVRRAKEWMENKDMEKFDYDIDSEQIYKGEEIDVYVEDEIQIGRRLTMAPGLRYSAFLVNSKTYQSPEPRLAVRYDILKNLAFKMSYTQMSQYVHMVKTLFIELPTSSWLPCTEEMKPMHSRQIAGGLYSRLPGGFHLEMEGFWKTMDNLYEYSGGFALYPPIEQWESSFTSGKGRSYGAEMGIGWTTDKTDISLAYTLSWSQRFFPELYYDWYFDKNDYRNMLNINVSHKFGDSFDIYCGWTYHTGSRITFADQAIEYLELVSGDLGGSNNTSYDYSDSYTEPNNIRMPAYHRLDIGMNFRQQTNRGNESIWNLSIYNAYCRINPIYAEIRTDEETGEMVGKSYGIIPVIPTISYTFRF